MQNDIRSLKKRNERLLMRVKTLKTNANCLIGSCKVKSRGTQTTSAVINAQFKREAAADATI